VSYSRTVSGFPVPVEGERRVVRSWSLFKGYEYVRRTFVKRVTNKLGKGREKAARLSFQVSVKQDIEVQVGFQSCDLLLGRLACPRVAGTLLQHRLNEPDH
jgi:hypothetical protein